MKTEEPHAETTTEGQLPAGEPAKAEPTTTTPAKQVEAPAASPPAASPDLSGELAVARKLTVLCWHLLTKQEDYHWARPALVANKTRAMELQAGRPQKKGNKPGSAYAYNVKALREQEMRIAEQAERSYERFVERWKPRPTKDEVRERLNPTRLE